MKRILNNREYWLTPEDAIQQIRTDGKLPPYDLNDVLSNRHWDTVMDEFDCLNHLSPKPTGSIVFTGSSSIRLWKTLEYDFPEYSVINRGFGGSHMCDVLYYFERLILPFSPKAVVIYEGDNDIEKGKSPSHIFLEYKQLCRLIHQSFSKIPIIFISVKASTKRWDKKYKILELNHLVEDWTHEDVRMGYAEVFFPMLRPDGTPNESFLVDDGLHMTLAGYQIWAKAVRSELQRLL